MRFDGVYVATVTPFDPSSRVDLQALTRHLEWLAQHSIAGFVPCGTTGEAPTLDDAERDLILSLTVKIAHAHKLRVVAGCGSNSTKKASAQIQRAKHLGCDAALVVTPYYNRPTPHGIEEHYLALADENHPILLYNVPSRTGTNLTPLITSRLLNHPNIIGIKEASGNHSQWLELSHEVDWREKSWLAGDDDAFATMLGLGACGIISATANVCPEQFANIYQAAKSNDLIRAFEIQKSILPMIRAAFIESNPGPIKYMLHKMNRMETHLRLPLVPPTDASKNLIDMSLKKNHL